MQSRSYLFLLIVLALGVLSGIGYVKKEPNLGLDIVGGARLTFAMDTSKLTSDQRRDMTSIRSTVVRTMTNRASGLGGATEAIVQPKGEDQIVVELPGFTDTDKATEYLKTTASIEWYHAKNVMTGKGVPRLYNVGTQIDYKGTPAFTFQRRSGGEDIKPGEPAYEQIIKGWGEPILKGDDLERAEAEPVGDGYNPTMKFSSKGAEKLEVWTRRNQNTGAQLAAVLDGVVISIAPLQDNTILRDNAQITGQFDKNYVFQLKELLNSGSLPVSLKLLSTQKVDPTIGKSALDQIIFAGVIAFVVITIFLMVYYALPGFIAFLALCLYVLFTLTVMKLINATFSLAAIAGFILSVGMAVDANILVFERFKEEMKRGKSLHSAIELGFKRALPAIVDSNVCSILTGLVLINLGTGPVKGFATMLVIGVAISLFTAVTVTRSLLMFAIDSGLASNPKFFAVERSWFGENFETNANEKPLEIVNNSRKWFAITAVFILASIGFMAAGGLKPNVEFLGGTEFEYAIDSNAPAGPAMAANLSKNGFQNANVKIGGSEKERVAYITLPRGVKMGEANQAATNVAKAAGIPNAKSLGFNEVGPQVADETLRNAVTGVAISFGLIIIYLGVRFGFAVGNFANGLRFGISAILAGVKDIFVIFGVAAAVGLFFGWEISALFLTAILTVIGFTVHDKIVIFDRVRENLRNPLPGETLEHLMNRSVTQSFARSINTAMTVIASLGLLIAFGTTTPDLKFFCVAMLAGIAWGTYSSIYTAAPVLYVWEKWVERKKGFNATLLGTAKAENSRARVTSTLVEDPVATNTNATGRTYGQVRRRASAVKDSRIELDD